MSSILALARRRPTPPVGNPKVTFEEADVAVDDLRPHLAGADAVVHLAWLFQPTHRPVVTWRANAVGSASVFAAGDPALLDLVLGLPLLDTTRARDELGWAPRHSSLDALHELIEGIAHGAGGSTPPLTPDSPGQRPHEVAGGVGERP